FAPHATDTLLEHGQDLLGTLVNTPALAARMAAWRLAQGTAPSRQLPVSEPSSIDQAHLFEQYLAVLRGLAAQRPLVLVLDDLHWADTSSLSLLFFLGRQLLQARLLVVATFRPEEVAVGWRSGVHPLPDICDELRRIHGESEISLDYVVETGGRTFIDALLATVPNRLNEGFRQELFRHSRGHPLFTVELLHNLQENCQLVQDDAGEWVAGTELS
ncbi:MAG: AAA family ATPase, partial [Caldilineaceae bacterium]|nr:AAA family ATPase [Caldilineaceae bacterium]